MPDEQPNLASLFEQAIAIESAEKRASFVKQQCGDNDALREQLERLLASDEQAGSFLENPAGASEDSVPTVAPRDQRSAAMEAGFTSAFSAEQAEQLANSDQSVLKSLGKTVDIPRVMLREADEEMESPLEHPASPQVPSESSDGRY